MNQFENFTLYIYRLYTFDELHIHLYTDSCWELSEVVLRTLMYKKIKPLRPIMSNGGECAARVTVRSAAARSIKSYKGGDAVLSGNKRGE